MSRRHLLRWLRATWHRLPSKRLDALEQDLRLVINLVALLPYGVPVHRPPIPAPRRPHADIVPVRALRVRRQRQEGHL